MRLSFSQKLSTLVIPTLLVGGIVGTIAWRSLSLGTEEVERAGHLAKNALLSRLSIIEMSDSLRGYMLNPADKTQAAKKKRADENNTDAIEVMKNLTTDAGVLTLINELEQFDEKVVNPLEEKINNLVTAGNAAAAREVYLNEYTPHKTQLIKMSESLNEKANEISANAIAEIGQKMKAGSKWIIGSLASGVVFILAAIFFLTSTLNRSFRAVIEKIEESATATGSSSDQLSGAAQQLAAGAAQGAASLEETVASLEELSSMVNLNTDNAKAAAELSQTSKQTAETGDVEIRKLITSVTEVAQGSKKIEEIINVIDDIAFQTNLLALNAAVEAARAGEQGKGFAVVAEAVRTLAQRSAAAAKDISKLIKESVAKSESGVKVADQSGLLLKEIVVCVNKVAALNLEISTASQQQSSGLSQISKAMGQLDSVIQNNAASAEQAAASSVEMANQAIDLQDQVQSLNAVIEGGRRTSKEASVNNQKHDNSKIGSDEGVPFGKAN